MMARRRSAPRKGRIEAPRRPVGSPDHGTRRRDRCPSPQIQLADLGGCLLLLSGLRINEAIPSEPPSLARLIRRATRRRGMAVIPWRTRASSYHTAAALRRASYTRCCESTVHAMRASLLARAVTSTLWCNRCAAAASQGPKPCLIQFLGRSRTTRAACRKSMRR
jgi:hypothetical protein